MISETNPSAAEALLCACVDDPWSLSASERQTLLNSQTHAVEPWIARLERAATLRTPADTLPVFLIEACGYLEPLAQGLRALDGQETAPDAVLRDLAQRFVDHFKDWSEAVASPGMV